MFFNPTKISRKKIVNFALSTAASFLLFSTLGAAQPQPQAAIIFDCDGVLVDSERLKYEAWREAFKKHEVEISISDYLPLVGYPSEHIFQSFQKQKGVKLPAQVLVEKNNIYQQKQAKGVPSIEASIRFLKELAQEKSQLGIKIGLASSAPLKEILVNLRAHQIDQFFDVIISGEDDLKFYHDIDGTNKPKPYIYIEAAKKLNLAPYQCLVIEDTQAGVDAAKRAGMQVIAFPNAYTVHQNFINADKVFLNFNPSNKKWVKKWIQEVNTEKPTDKPEMKIAS